MVVNPDIPEAHALRGWFDAAGSEQAFQAHTNTSSMGGGVAFDRAEIRNLNEVKTSELGMSDKNDYFSARATISHIKEENLSYPACPTQGCGKKVIQLADKWRCERCDKSYDKPEHRSISQMHPLTRPLLIGLHRYMISMAVTDYSGQAWFQGFNDIGQTIFGMTADELVDIRVSVLVVFAAATDTHWFAGARRREVQSGTWECDWNDVQLCVQGETGHIQRTSKSLYCLMAALGLSPCFALQDQTRVRYGISRILPLNYREEANYLANQLLNSEWAR